MLPDRIIEVNTLVARSGRIAISVRIPWYRALPLSSITGVEFAIDGVEVRSESITWTINGHAYHLDELPPLFEEWWYVLDSAVIEGDIPKLDERAEHEVRVKVGLYIPYLPAGPDAFIAIGEQDIKRMPLRQEVAA